MSVASHNAAVRSAKNATLTDPVSTTHDNIVSNLTALLTVDGCLKEFHTVGSSGIDIRRQ